MIRAENIWRSTPDHLAPASGEIHLFRASLNQPVHRIFHLTRMLSADERERAQRFNRDSDRQRFVTGRGQLRAILASLLQVEPGQLVFEYGPFGKPRLASPSRGRTLHFNVAHSEALVVYAFANEEIGVDVECLRPLPEALAIAGRFFAAGDAARLRSLPLNAQVPAFFNLWTRTEALIKAAGGSFDDLPLESDPAISRNSATSTGADELKPWNVQSFEPVVGYVGALATKLKDPQLLWWDWP